MSNYKGLFTFDEDSHKYIPISIAGAEGIIDAIGHKPVEPLIKDENVRKAVRAWAGASGIEKVLSYGDMYWIGFRSTNTASVWKFECNYIDGSKFQLDKEYTIAELCGEDNDD